MSRARLVITAVTVEKRPVSNGAGALSAELSVLWPALGRTRNRQEREAREHTDDRMGTDNPRLRLLPVLAAAVRFWSSGFLSCRRAAGVRDQTELAGDVSRWSLQGV